jgi:nuclear GTP-binding protein
MLFYNLPAFSKGDTNAFLSGIARSNGMVKKGGALDQAGAARIVLRDWSVGKFPRFTPTPAASEASFLTRPTPSLAELYSKDEEALSTLKTRKEMRKSTGLIKLVAGHVENRKVDIEAGWAGAEHEKDDQNEDEDDDGEETGTEDEEDEDVELDDVEELEEDESEEDEEPVPAPSGKRKRPSKSTASPAHPSKKVSFAADPKESKQARAAAGAAKKAAQATPKSKPVSSKLKASKVANVSTGKASQKSTAPSKGDEEAYDFGKFF